MITFLRAFAFSGLVVCAAVTAEAAVVEGTFTATVTSASDPGQLAFGRDPALWVGKTVTGTFSYDVETQGVVDQDSAAAVWTYGDPTRNTRWVYVSASIDGVAFATSPRDANPAGTIGGVVGIHDGSFGGGDKYGVQDAYLSFAGRSLVGFDVFGPASLFTYSGSGGGVQFPFDPTQPGVSGSGLIEDIAISGGVEVRSGTIRFRLTGLTFGKSTATLIADLLTTVTAVGPGSSLADKMAIVQAYYTAGDMAAVCAELTAFENQVSAQAGRKLTVEQAAALLDDAHEIGTKGGCL